MTRSLLTTSTLALALSGCGSSDPSGLYGPRTTGTDSGFSHFPPSSSGGSRGGSTEQDASSTDGTGDGSKPPKQDPPKCDGYDADDDEGDCSKCSEDESCAPLICNKKLDQCAAPGGPGTPCERDIECASDECKKGHCE